MPRKGRLGEVYDFGTRRVCGTRTHVRSGPTSGRTPPLQKIEFEEAKRQTARGGRAPPNEADDFLLVRSGQTAYRSAGQPDKSFSLFGTSCQTQSGGLLRKVLEHFELSDVGGL